MEGWTTIEADGCVWEVRSVTNPDHGLESGQVMLEFHTSDGNLPARRVAVEKGAVGDMDAQTLRSAYLRALPIGGDHYGRPGKRMTDSPGA
jgi:hypothetical protein